MAWVSLGCVAQRAKQPCRFVFRPGREVQRIAVAQADAVAELQPPEAGDGGKATVGVAQIAQEATAVAVKRRDVAATAEVAHQYGAAEGTEGGRGNGYAPRRIEVFF